MAARFEHANKVVAIAINPRSRKTQSSYATGCIAHRKVKLTHYPFPFTLDNVSLTFEVMVEQEIMVLPNPVRLGPVARVESTEVGAELRYRLDAVRGDIRVSEVECDPQWVRAAVSRLELEDKSPEESRLAPGAGHVTVTASPPVDAPLGPITGTMRVSFNKGLGVLEVPIEGEMVSPLFAEPDRVLFGLVRDDAEMHRVVHISASSPAELELTELASDLPFPKLTQRRIRGR